MLRFIIGVIAAVFLSFTAAFNASGAEDDDFMYSIINGEAVIVGFNGEPSELDIPDFIGCYPVTEVRDNAFCNCRSLKRISLPSTLTRLGHHCFYACYSLQSIALPDSITGIGEGCFCGCTGLVAAELPDSLENLPDSCFRACTSLTEIELPEQLKEIGNFCFAGCTSLEAADTGDELLSIGERAFFMCDRLESIFIPPSCKSIGAQAVGYTCDGNMELRRRDMVIKGSGNSAAEHCAEDNGLQFYEEAKAESAFAAGDSTCRRTALIGSVIFGLLILALLRIVFTDWSDQ